MAFGVSRQEAEANRRRYEDRVRRANEQVDREREESRERAQRYQDSLRGSVARAPERAAAREERVGRSRFQEPTFVDPEGFRRVTPYGGPLTPEEEQSQAEASIAKIEAQKAEDANTIWEFTPHNAQRRAGLMAANQKLQADPNFTSEEKAIGSQQIQVQLDTIEKTPRQRTKADGPRYEQGKGPGDSWPENGGIVGLDRSGNKRFLVQPDKMPEYLERKAEAAQKEAFDKNAFDRRKFQYELAAETVKVGVGMEAHEEPRYTELEVRHKSNLLYPLSQEEFKELYPLTWQERQGIMTPESQEAALQPAPPQEPQEVQAAREVLDDPKIPYHADRTKILREAQGVIEQWEKGVADVDKKLPVVSNDADWKKLASGQRFRDSEGIEWVKK